MAEAKRAAKKVSGGRKHPDTASNAIDEQLERYRSMRNFGVTAEPSGAQASGAKSNGVKARETHQSQIASGPALPFCIQKHAASHLHYDFRLGWNGVLKSWACAKGPSYTVADKRLAVQVEDHPIEYGGFEGIIPAGQYGGGTVLLWDQGTWEPQEAYPDVDAGLRTGSLKFVLHGTKLKGKWALIRMGGKAANERKPNWLLIKEHDEFERPNGPAVTETEPDSVVTGRSLEQIAESKDHVWNSKDTAKGEAWYRQESKSVPNKAAVMTGTGKPKKIASGETSSKQSDSYLGKLGDLPKEPQPVFIKPQLALEAEDAPESPGWLHELKLDGYRMQARKHGQKVQMLTRTGLDWTDRIPLVAAAVRSLSVDKITLDGEVVVLSSSGTTNFADLQAAFQEGARNPLTYFCFDLLHMEGRNTRELPLKDRKALLHELLAGAGTSLKHREALRISEHLESNGREMFQQACALGAEGIVSKRATAKYSSGRCGDWLKLKCLHEQEFVIGGYTLPSNGVHGVGALLLGYYRDGKLIYAGRSGTGFTQKTHRLIRDKLEGLVATKPPFAAVSTEARRGARWVRPELVAQIRFATWTADNQLRQAAFLGLREDKSAREVVREDAAPMPKRGRSQGKDPQPVKASSKAVAAIKEKAPVRLTHPDKILDAESGMSKQMLADYYWAVAEHMLPHIADRPLSLVRCPEGSGKPCFYQKHVTPMLPAGIGTVLVPDKKTGKQEPYITLNTAEALAGLAQMGVLELHPWGAKNSDLERADRLVFDLDPDESLRWTVVIEAATDVRARLKKLGMESFPKTTGGKGLHIVVAIKPSFDWNTIKTFAHHFVLGMEKASPSLYLSKMTKSARAGKIYLDYLRNERGATSVAAYSPRARSGAPVSMPLAWNELKLSERPQFHVSDFAVWRSRLKKNPWKAMPESAQMLSRDALRAVGMKGI